MKISELIHELETRLPDDVDLLDCNEVKIKIGYPDGRPWASYDGSNPPKFAVITAVIAVKLP